MVLSKFLTIHAFRNVLAEINPTERAEVSVENNEKDLFRAREKNSNLESERWQGWQVSGVCRRAHPFTPRCRNASSIPPAPSSAAGGLGRAGLGSPTADGPSSQPGWVGGEPSFCRLARDADKQATICLKLHYRDRIRYQPINKNVIVSHQFWYLHISPCETEG